MGNEEEVEKDKKKPHRERRAGRKAEKKKAKTPHVQELTAKQRNPKAFTFNSAIRAERRFRRKQDLKSKKEHIPVVDRTPLEPPPILVAVVGPPKVGKTTLINCLIKSYTRQPLTTIKGPVTVVSGKKKRITFIECNNDINSMVDIAKVADLCLLLIDASFGFEMEIFEFLNVCQVHGMPKIMGVLTHLDMIKNAKALKRTKKTLKHRFWKEVYAGAKLFYLSGLLHEEYLRNEVKNLSRFISVMKFRPLTWQTTHPYVLADRMEDLTSTESIRLNPKVDRTVCFYGYMRGIPMNKTGFIHVPGCGDFPIDDISFLPDPCPLPETIKKRTLIEKERLIYAPFSGVGGIVYDKDAVYIELAGSHSHTSEPNKEMVNNLLETKETLDVKLAQSQVQLFSGGDLITAEEFEKGQMKEGEADETDSGEEDEVESDDEEVHSDSDEEVTVGMKRKKSTHTSVLKIDRPLKKKSKGDPCVSDIENTEEKRAWSVKKALALLKDADVDWGDDDSGSDLEKEATVSSKIKETRDGLLSEEDAAEDGDYDDDEARLSISQREEAAKLRSVLSEKDEELRNKISGALAALEEKKFAPAEWSECSSSDDEEGKGEDNEKRVRRPWVREDGESGIEDDDSDEEDVGDESEEDAEDKSDEDDSDDQHLQDTGVNWKSNLAQKAADAFIERQNSKANLWKLVYGDDSLTPINAEEDENDGEEEVLGGIFKVVRKQQEEILKGKDSLNGLDCSKFPLTYVSNWSEEEVHKRIRNCFVTGKWDKGEDANELLKLDDMSDPDDEELFGDFEDLETGEKFGGKNNPPSSDKDYSDNEGEEKKPEKELSKEELMERKMKLKEKFDSEYDKKDGDDETTYFDELKSEANKQAEINRSQFEGLDDNVRVEIEGFRPGMYVRVEVKDAPCELVDNFDPTYPLIIGGLQPGEQNIGYVKVRVKKHRWYNKILKTRDPLIISMGWRRFQTIAVYSKQEDDMRHRMLKYTPQHEACMGHFWGPMTKAGTGFLALLNAGSKERVQTFRIVATGAVVDTNQSTAVTKKLKLIGTPLKIMKKTAFIQGMFNSTLEVAKFEGAKIRTVSGIRGQIKKAINNPEGAFRASFEDKILKSDIVFCRTWYKVDIPQLYLPITTLLLPSSEKNTWEGMKTLGELKRERGIKNEAEKDSIYTEIQRPPKIHKKLVIPRALEKELPYKYKRKTGKYDGSNAPFSKKIQKVVVRDEYESQVSSMLRKLATTYVDKKKKERKAMQERIKQFNKKKEAEQLKMGLKHKAIKKRVYRALSKAEGKKKKPGKG